MSTELATTSYINSNVMPGFTPVNPFPNSYCPATAELREKYWLSNSGDTIRVGVVGTQPWECPTEENVSRKIIPYGGTEFTVDRGSQSEYLTAHSGIIDNITVLWLSMDGSSLGGNVSATRPGVARLGLFNLHLENDSSFRVTVSPYSPANFKWVIKVGYNLQTTIYTIIAL